ncbi:MAG: hypothetical protein N2511_01980 [Thermodesulfovibrionales bacterium]|nr:hypothetical protein [Thermodesulfovibrionales bacterium]
MYTNRIGLIILLIIWLDLSILTSHASLPHDRGGLCEQEKPPSQVCEDLPVGGPKPPYTPDIRLDKTKKIQEKIIIYFFEGRGCPFCEKKKNYLKELKGRYKNLHIKDFEVWHNRENAILMAKMLQAFNLKPQGVPVTFVGDRVFIGFSEEIQKGLLEIIERCSTIECPDPYERAKNILASKEAQSEINATKNGHTSVELPLIGGVDPKRMSLPVLTVTIAGLDSFNPCAFFVLFALLGLLTHAGSRRRILMIGGIFVFFSGFIYFVFMAAWLNLFIFMGNVAGITTSAGIIAILISLINIKDFFAFKKGVSLTIPESAKPALFDKMRKLMKSTSTLSILLGTIVLAITANSYELLCTAGFPLVYTRILTLNELSTSTYYLYLVLYNLVYVIPLLIIVIAFAVTFGKRKLSEREGRLLKLLSGIMMLELGSLLLFKPELLNSVIVSVILLASAIIVTFIAAHFTKKH